LFGVEAAHVIFPRQHIERWGFDPEILFLAKKFKLETAEVPVEWAHDHRSKISPLRDGLRMGSEVLQVRWNEMRGKYEQPTFPVQEFPVAEAAPKANRSRKAATAEEGKPTAREGSKKAIVLEMLKRPDGATLKDIMAATEWQAHSVRGFISGSIAKKMGLTVESFKREDGDRAYRLAQ
jgi:hypothetical protein